MKSRTDTAFLINKRLIISICLFLQNLANTGFLKNDEQKLPRFLQIKPVANTVAKLRSIPQLTATCPQLISTCGPYLPKKSCFSGFNVLGCVALSFEESIRELLNQLGKH